MRDLRRQGITAEQTRADPGRQPLRRSLTSADAYVVTYAQNATPAYQPFLKALLVYCEATGAQLVVLPGRYTNPTSIWSHNMKSNEWWDPALHPYLFSGRKTLNGNVTLYGDISIQPTATRPLSGFEVFSGQCSAVFGHPKLQLKTVATAKRRYPRILTTTGAVTKANYTSSKAGKKAEAHHVFGATIIEVDEAGLCHLRQINAVRDGTFIDLDKRYTESGVTEAGRALALVCGDIHVEQADLDVVEATFYRDDSIVKTLKPETIVYHDVLDFRVRNHHSINSFTDRYARAVDVDTADRVEDEVCEAVKFLDESTPEDTCGVVVQSNHDEAFDRWLNEADPKRDPVNARFFYEMWSRKIEVFEASNDWVPAFELAYGRFGAQRNIRFLRRGDPLKIAGIHCGFHGDKGLNGTRGSVSTYAQLGVKTISGHHHAPSILDSAYVVGVTGSLDQGYNFTPSNWLHSHCVVYANGKRSLLHVLDGQWRR